MFSVTEIAYHRNLEFCAKFFPKICFLRHAYIKREISAGVYYQSVAREKIFSLKKANTCMTFETFPCHFKFLTCLTYYRFLFFVYFYFAKVIVISHVKFITFTNPFTIQ